jgi:transposase
MAKLDNFVPVSHPVSQICPRLKNVFKCTSAVFSRAYECDAKRGRPGITPDKLTRALLLRVLYLMRSERTLMEQIFYIMLLRWFVAMAMDGA